MSGIEITTYKGETKTIPWGFKPSGAIWVRIVLDRAPRTRQEEEWVRDVLLVRLTEAGTFVDA